MKKKICFLFIFSLAGSLKAMPTNFGNGVGGSEAITVLRSSTGTFLNSVSIGTTTNSQSDTLFLYGGSANNESIRMQSDATGVGPTDGLKVGMGSVNLAIVNYENGTFTMGTNAATDLTLSSSHNFGIGDFTPVSKFDVRGNVTIGSTYSGTNAAATSGLLVEGSVGIATTAANTALDVQGTIRTTSSSSTPSLGKGVEIFYNTGSDFGNILAIDRNPTTFKPLKLTGSTLTLLPNNVATVLLTSTTMAVTGDFQTASLTAIDAYFTAVQTVTSGSTATLTWTELSDRASEFVTSSFTVVYAGYYEISVQAGASQTAGTGCLLIKDNNATVSGAESCATGATALATVLNPNLHRILNLSVGDVIRIDGSATSANVSFQKASLAIRRVP